MSSKKDTSFDESVLDKNNPIDEKQAEHELEGVESIDSRDQRIVELEKQIDEVHKREREVLLRTRAEIENINRRAALDVEKAHKFALERFAAELLNVVDNLERAVESIEAPQTELTAVVEGVELTLKALMDVLSKFGIEPIDALNAPFNPEMHQAMTMMESDQHVPNQVMMVMQKGYTLNGRLLRPAMVAVAKAKGG